ATASYLARRRATLRDVVLPEPRGDLPAESSHRRLPIEAFFDGTVQLRWQLDERGNVNLQENRVAKMAKADNPARDAVEIRDTGRELVLTNGFHRVSELWVRGYRGEVNAIVTFVPEQQTHWNRRYRSGAFDYLDEEGGQAMFADIAARVQAVGARSVLDVGCWHGNLLRALDDIDTYVGFDLSDLAVEQARSIEKPFDVRFAVGDLTAYPIEAMPFDVIYLGGCMGYVEDKIGVIVEYARRYQARHLIWQETPGFVDIDRYLAPLWMTGLFDLVDALSHEYPLRKYAKRKVIVLRNRAARPLIG
ncbi:MAG: class I SAM-dependent methyltransferase, partial [Myxococcales bacterium]|nr:class I SAM-dependent methyltransferase [Myxococcales bacterium]